MQLRISALYPNVDLKGVTKMLENSTIWPCIDEMTVPTLFSICGIIHQQYGIRGAAKYVRRGVALNPQKFDGLQNELERQFQTDFVWINNCLSINALTNDEWISIGEFWTWGKKRLGAKVRKRVGDAYRSKGLAETAAEWCGIGVFPNAQQSLHT